VHSVTVGSNREPPIWMIDTGAGDVAVPAPERADLYVLLLVVTPKGARSLRHGRTCSSSEKEEDP
jgi:hypothetical protein